jgi:MIP family channel proteins
MTTPPDRPTPHPDGFGQPMVAEHGAPGATRAPAPSSTAPSSYDYDAAGSGEGGAGSDAGSDTASGKSEKRSTTGGLYGSDLAVNIVRASVAEFLGTFLLVLAGTAVVVAGGLNTGVFDGLAPALAFGLMLVALVTALGHISGCHLNPAVTLGLAASRKFPISHVPSYLAAQFAGAVVAALTVWAAYGDSARDQLGLGAPAPAPGVGILRTGFVEAVITFLLVLVIVSVATDDRVPSAAAGLAVGFALFAAISIGGTVTGGSVNPARALGPMLVAGTFPQWAVYLIAPVIGGVVASLLYSEFLSKGDEPST